MSPVPPAIVPSHRCCVGYVSHQPSIIGKCHPLAGTTQHHRTAPLEQSLPSKFLSLIFIYLFIDNLCLVAKKMKGKKTMIPLFLIDLLVLNMVSFFSFFDRTVSLCLCVFIFFKLLVLSLLGCTDLGDLWIVLI